MVHLPIGNADQRSKKASLRLPLEQDDILACTVKSISRGSDDRNLTDDLEQHSPGIRTKRGEDAPVHAGGLFSNFDIIFTEAIWPQDAVSIENRARRRIQ